MGTRPWSLVLPLALLADGASACRDIVGITEISADGGAEHDASVSDARAPDDAQPSDAAEDAKSCTGCEFAKGYQCCVSSSGAETCAMSCPSGTALEIPCIDPGDCVIAGDTCCVDLPASKVQCQPSGSCLVGVRACRSIGTCATCQIWTCPGVPYSFGACARPATGCTPET